LRQDDARQIASWKEQSHHATSLALAGASAAAAAPVAAPKPMRKASGSPLLL
jgi:hypothetical protein